MAYKIVAAECVNCGACEPVCPNGAVTTRKGTYVIDPALCTVCEGHHDTPQCASVCPTDCCVPAA
ncbi:MAG TPA: 4Fe-4S binding protein [Azospirillum sp.]|nr:4Fe-4S binding protein [Azospirillum sp.]